MPTYQYACTACGHQLEAVQSFSDAPLTTCPECEGRLRKVFSSVGIVFKGSGFYRTDSRSGSPASETAAKSDSSSSAGSSSGSATSSSGDSSPGTSSSSAATPSSGSAGSGSASSNGGGSAKKSAAPVSS